MRVREMDQATKNSANHTYVHTNITAKCEKQTDKREERHKRRKEKRNITQLSGKKIATHSSEMRKIRNCVENNRLK